MKAMEVKGKKGKREIPDELWLPPWENNMKTGKKKRAVLRNGSCRA